MLKLLNETVFEQLPKQISTNLYALYVFNRIIYSVGYIG